MTKHYTLIIAAALGAAALAGCQKEGPMERAGKEIDKAAASTQQSIDQALSKEGPAEQAGKKVDQAVEKAGEKIDQAATATGEKIKEAGEATKEKLQK